MHDVISIGSTTRDSFWKTNFELVDWSKVPSGKALAIPLGEKFGTEEVYFSLGGNAANASITFARQGLKPAVFTRLGGDAAGEETEKIFRRERVNTQLIETAPKELTSTSVIFLQGGERSIVTYHGAINGFSLKGVDASRLGAKWWYVSLPGDSYKLFHILLDYALKRHIQVALNPSYKHLEGTGRKMLLSHLAKIDFLVLNDDEASALTGLPFEGGERLMKRLGEMTRGVVAVTRGPKGVMVFDGRLTYQAGVFEEKKVVDRTGAGDAFGSGFVSGLMKNGERCERGKCLPNNIEYAIRLASANATSVVEKIGATEGILSSDEFERSRRWAKLKITKN